VARRAFGLARQLRICARLLAEWWSAIIGHAVFRVPCWFNEGLEMTTCIPSNVKFSLTVIDKALTVIIMCVHGSLGGRTLPWEAEPGHHTKINSPTYHLFSPPPIVQYGLRGAELANWLSLILTLANLNLVPGPLERTVSLY
jgi:hypothetical protein